MSMFDTIKHDDDGCVWNLAYGANMNVYTLTTRRKIKPLESIGGILPGWKFSFDFLGLPFVEPAFSVVHPGEPSDCCHGVLHKMTKKDFIRLLRSEGGGGFEVEGYRPVEVYVDAYDGRKIRAYVLSSTKGVLKPGIYPSRRYLKLLHDGAVHHKLDQKWIDFLAGHPHHVSTIGGIVMVGAICTLILPVFLVLFVLNRCYPTKHMHALFHNVAIYLWRLHDAIPFPASIKGTVARMMKSA